VERRALGYDVRFHEERTMFERLDEPTDTLEATGIKAAAVFGSKVCGVLIELQQGKVFVPIPGPVLVGLAKDILGMVAAHAEIAAWGSDRIAPRPNTGAT
jgi:hypothetical protein